MKKKEKIEIIAAISAAVVISTISIGTSIAYLGDRDKKENKQTVTHGDVEISEDWSEPTELSMVNDIKKEYYVKNTGTVTSFARLYAEFSDSEIAEHIKIKYTASDNMEKEVLWNDFKKDLKSNGNILSDDWEYIESDNTNPGLGGYFYYKKPLKPGDSTPALINSVILDFQKYDSESKVVDGSNIDRITDIEKIVYAELVQTVETGYKMVNSKNENNEDVKVSVYGYDYASVPDTDDPTKINVEWKEAWISFLEKKKNR